MPAVVERDLLLPWLLLHIYGHYQSRSQRSHVSLQYLLKSFFPLEALCTFIMVGCTWCSVMLRDKTRSERNSRENMIKNMGSLKTFVRLMVDLVTKRKFSLQRNIPKKIGTISPSDNIMCLDLLSITKSPSGKKFLAGPAHLYRPLKLKSKRVRYFLVPQQYQPT